MATVAPAQPVSMSVEPTADDLAANTAANAATTASPLEDRDDDDDPDDDEDAGAPKEWDEGGLSHCGYGDSVHDTLMSIGETIHKVVGEPGDGTQGVMRGIGTFFQEASYAARDAQRGELDVKGEAREAMKSVVSGDEENDQKEEEEGGENNDGGEAAGEAEMGRGGEDDKPDVAKESESGKEGATSTA